MLSVGSRLELMIITITVAGRIIAPKDALTLNPRTCEYVILNGKEDLW